jgi:hypothetical protein
MLRYPSSKRCRIPFELDLGRVVSRGYLADAENALARGWPVERSGHARQHSIWNEAILTVPGLELWTGRVAGSTVCTAFALNGCSSSSWHSYRPSRRAQNRGYGTAVAWRATMSAPKLPALLHATSLGEQVYERMGYRTVALASRWQRLIDNRSKSGR